MKLAIVTNKNILNYQEVLVSIKDSLSKVGLEYDVLSVDSLKSGYDFVCSVGGDGTMLKTSRFYSKTSTPVMGINLGRLGFLSLILPDDVSNLGSIIKNKKYTLRDRMMLSSEHCFALNDFVIKGHSSARTSKFKLYINDILVSDYIADGIIVATPTGSTAYGLSAGGPILHPGFDAMVIVPICAHTMTARPIVVPAKEVIRIESADELLDLSCDGQITVQEIRQVVIKSSEYKAKLAFPEDYKFYKVMRNKLHWGISPVSE